MINNRIVASAVAAALAGVGLTSSLPAGAQALEEIVVTARKTQETLQAAPITVTAFTESAIQNLDIRSVDDIARFTPGLSTSAYVGRRGDRPVIRSQSNVLAGVQFGVESGTAYFVDGVYWPGAISALDMNDVSRVEVIKGPQSALYGRNTYAGAINFVTRDVSNEFEARVTGTAARYDEYQNTISLSGPIVADQLYFSVHGRYYEYGGEYRNQLNGDKVGQERTKSFSGALTWQPTDNFRARLRTSFAKDRDGAAPIFLWDSDQNNCFPGFASNFYFRNQLEGVPFVYGTNQNQYYCGTVPARPDLLSLTPQQLPLIGFERYQWLTTLAVDMALGESGYNLAVQGGYRTERDRYGADSDFRGELLSALTTQQRNDVEDYSVEVRLSSPTEERLRWLVGTFYYDQTDDQYALSIANPTGFGIPPGIEVTTENQALFGLIEYDFGDRLTGTLEARYAEEKKTRATPSPAFNDGRTYYSFTPRATLGFELTPDVNLYGVLARGNKPGGINGAAGLPVNAPFYEEETSTNFEVGAKTRLLDGRMTANVAAYFTDAKDVQLTTPVASTTGAVTSIATNQGSAEIWGLELELQAAVTDNLLVGFGYTFSRPRFTEGCDDAQYTLKSGGFVIPGSVDQLTPAQLELCSIKGNRLPLTSEHQASINARYTQALGRGYEWFVSGDVTYESSKFAQVHNLAETGDATVAGLQLGIESDRLRVALFGRNIFDEDTVVNVTRWGDVAYGFAFGPGANRAPASVDGQTVAKPVLGPRAYFTTLRRGASYGIQASYRF